MAPAGDIEGGNMWLGWAHQILGLNCSGVRQEGSDNAVMTEMRAKQKLLSDTMTQYSGRSVYWSSFPIG